MTVSLIDPVDVHVGARIRNRRRFMGLSQTDLAKASSITFQQVQKYERGANRVSASRLVQFARTLGVSPAWFFESLPGVATDTPLDHDEAQRLIVAADPDVSVMLDELVALGPEVRTPIARLCADWLRLIRHGPRRRARAAA